MPAVSRRGLLWFAGACAAAALFLPVILPRYGPISRLERELNAAYRNHRPFPFRWPGAPHSAERTGASAGSLRGAAVRVLRLGERMSNDERWLILRARLALLNGDHDDAIRYGKRARLIAPGASGAAPELAVAYALRAASESRDADYAPALEFASEAVAKTPGSSAALFNLALICERVPLRRMAAANYRAAAAAESDRGWRAEAARRAQQLEQDLQRQRFNIALLRRPAPVPPELLALPGALEIRQSEAIRTWIANPEPPAAELRTLARALLAQHGDRWWTGFLDRGSSPAARRLLSSAHAANLRGEHAQAERLAAEAEQAFAREGNPAGRLWARRVRIEAGHRGDSLSSCPSLLEGFVAEASKRSYTWLLAQAQLDDITCRTAALSAPSYAGRESLATRLAQYRFEGVTLRALAFLTEPWVASARPGSTWTCARGALARLRQSVLPGYRSYHVCWGLAESARLGGDLHAARVLFGEAAAELDDNDNPGLRAAVTGDVAAAYAEAGLHREAGDYLRDAARLLTAAQKGASKYRFQVGIERALAELAGGHGPAALAELDRIERSPTPEFDRADFLNAYGLTLLHLRRYAEARSRFRQLLDTTAALMRDTSAGTERRSLARLYDAALRGLVEAELRSGHPPERVLSHWLTLRDGRSLRPETDAAIPREPLSLYYVFLPSGVSAWFAGPTGVEQRWLHAPPIREAATRFAGLIPDHDVSPALLDGAARQLGELLLGPWDSRLRSPAGSAPPLFIDADGALAAIPWAALRTRGGAALLERYAVVQSLGTPRAAGGVPLAIAPSLPVAIFADPAAPNLPRLAEAADEGTRVASRFRSAVLVRGAAATRDRFVAEAQKTRLLHFAGHGISNGGFGALALAGSPAWIAADQIASLRLSRLDLVVLASCWSGIGDETRLLGSEVLARAFLEAGAQRVVAASWPVDSLAAGMLSDRFYRHLFEGAAPSAALRAALLDLRAEPATSHPAVWAAFRLYGLP